MTSKKRMITAAIGLALGAAIFSGAAMADLPTSSGYEVGKTALKGLLQNENYTMEAKMSMSVDGAEFMSTEVSEQYDRNGDVKLKREEKDTSSGDYQAYMGTPSEYKNYFQDGKEITVYVDEDGTEQTSIYSGKYYETFRNGKGCFDSFYDEEISEDDRKMQDRIVNFVELAGDTFVGDLKNNIIYTSGDDNSATYEMNLDAMQIPEVVNAGAALLFGTKGIDEEDPIAKAVGEDTIIKNVYLKFTVDSEKRLSYANVKVTAAGNGHEAAADISLKIYDYGTTKPERVDISSLKNVTKYDDEYYEKMNGENTVEDEDVAEKAMSVTSDGEVLDEDGNVVGHIQINENGEGVMVGGADGKTTITVTQ